MHPGAVLSASETADRDMREVVVVVRAELALGRGTRVFAGRLLVVSAITYPSLSDEQCGGGPRSRGSRFLP